MGSVTRTFGGETTLLTLPAAVELILDFWTDTANAGVGGLDPELPGEPRGVRIQRNLDPVSARTNPATDIYVGVTDFASWVLELLTLVLQRDPQDTGLRAARDLQVGLILDALDQVRAPLPGHNAAATVRDWIGAYGLRHLGGSLQSWRILAVRLMDILAGFPDQTDRAFADRRELALLRLTQLDQALTSVAAN